MVEKRARNCITENDETIITAEANVPMVPLHEGDGSISDEKNGRQDAFQVDLDGGADKKTADSADDETATTTAPPTMYTITNEQGETEEVGEDDARIRDIPAYVRRVVRLTDDPTELCITFRYFVLTVLFVAPGAFLSQMSQFRTTAAPYSVFFVQIASDYAGQWLARVLPRWRIGIGRWGFSLNPGPFTTKEHVLIVMSAASGATYNLGYAPIAMSELYFGTPVNGAVVIFFMLAITWIGYSYAALARSFLIYDPEYPWFQALCQVALFETQKKQREHPTRLSRKQTRVFFAVLGGVILWQFLPEFVFPLLGSLAFLCWVAPHNPTANFLGSGLGGMGLLNLSLDWSSIAAAANGSSLFLTPFWTQAILFAAYVVGCWGLIPAAKFGNMALWNHQLMSNRVFQENGTQYPLTELLTPQGTLNQTAYEKYGPLYSGPQYLWNMFFDYAAYTSAIVWVILFGRAQIKRSWTKFRLRRRDKKPGGGKMADQYGDQINLLLRQYDDAPLWWFVALFLVSFAIMMAIVTRGLLFIPTWTYFVALATGAIIVIPLGWLYALSNFQLAIGTTNELWYGLMVNSGGAKNNKNPCGASVYGAIAGDAWYRSQLFLQDARLGCLMHVPPRAVFFSQVFGSLLGVPIDYAVVKWVLGTKADLVAGRHTDPTHQWTGQKLATSLSSGVQYVLVGPSALFREAIYRPVPWGFAVGAAAPVVVYGLHRMFPRAKLHLCNTTIFFSGLSVFYGNISTGYLSSFLGGAVVMFWAYRYRYGLWARWNYILAAAFDAGFNFNMLLIFLCFGAAKTVVMPEWWGNDGRSSERCFASS